MNRKMAKSRIYDEMFDEICIFEKRKMTLLAAKSLGAHTSLFTLTFRELHQKTFIQFFFFIVVNMAHYGAAPLTLQNETSIC